MQGSRHKLAGQEIHTGRFGYSQVLKVLISVESELIQNWRPWDKSTGAITPEGKAVSSRNAHKGGIRSLCKEMNTLLREHKEAMKRFD